MILRAISSVYRVALWFLVGLRYLARAEHTTTVVDDSDTAIAYKGIWSDIQGTNQVGNAVHLTRFPGATASYSFTGTGISVFGTQGTPGGNATVSTYSIDGASPSQYTVGSDVTEIQHQVQFFASPTLANGQHTLVITNLNDQAWYWLDFLKVTSPVPSSPITSSAGVNSNSNSHVAASPSTTSAVALSPQSSTIGSIINTSPGISSASVTMTGLGATILAAASPDPIAADATASSHKVAVSNGAIAGIALASAALVALLILAFLWWKRRAHRSNANEAHVDPFKKPTEGPLTHGHVLPYQVEYFDGSANIPNLRRNIGEENVPRDPTGSSVPLQQPGAPVLNSSASGIPTTSYLGG